MFILRYVRVSSKSKFCWNVFCCSGDMTYISGTRGQTQTRIRVDSKCSSHPRSNGVRNRDAEWRHTVGSKKKQHSVSPNSKEKEKQNIFRLFMKYESQILSYQSRKRKQRILRILISFIWIKINPSSISWIYIYGMGEPL